MLRADGKGWSYGDVRELIVGDDLSDEVLAGLGIGEAFTHVKMENRSSCIFTLEIILVFERFECIVREVHGKLGRVRVVRIVRSP